MYLQSIGIASRFINGWIQAQAILTGTEKVDLESNVKFKTTILKPNEARRTSETIKMVLQTCEESMTQSSFDAQQLYSVFVSSDGDPNILQSICSELASEDKFVSPTQFHNSVHNAPAGYWTIGQQSMKGANSLACGESSISGGLLEVQSLLETSEEQVLLTCFDLQSPQPLSSARKIAYSMANSFILTKNKTEHSLFSLEINRLNASENEAMVMEDGFLDKLRTDSAAGKSLAFLQAVAQAKDQVLLPYYSDSLLEVRLLPCS